MLTEIQKKNNVKTEQIKERRKFWVLSKIGKIVLKIVLSEDVLRLANNCFFYRIDRTEDTGKVFPLLAGEDCEIY